MRLITIHKFDHIIILGKKSKGLLLIPRSHQEINCHQVVLLLPCISYVVDMQNMYLHTTFVMYIC